MAGADVGRQEPLRRRWFARRADRAAGDRRRVAGRPRHGLVLDADAVRGPQRGGARRSGSPSPTSGSSCRCSAAASAPSATSTIEAHVAALARAAGRPVKLVFSREEEFIAPDHRRESIADRARDRRRGATARIVARRARLVLDGGAYCGEGGFFAQMAAMHACGPYVIENVDVDSKLVYTNNQPSGSIRAPTAPQTCWAVEQHMDEVAAALDMDPVELRRRTLIDEGDESPTRQVFGPLGMKETLERAVELIGYGQELPDNEAIGVACGWWPSFGVRVRRLREAQRRRHRHDRHRRAGERQRRRDGAAAARRAGARACAPRTSRSSTRTPTPGRGTWARRARRRRSTTAARSIEAASEVADKLRELAAEKLEIDPLDLELRRRRRDGSRARRRRRSRSPSSPGAARRSSARARARCRTAPSATPTAAASAGWDGVVPRAAADHACGARAGRPRDRRRPRPARRRGARLGHDPQPDRRRRPGARRRGDGHRPGALGGHAARRRRPPAQPAPARLQARDGRRRAADRDRLGRDAGRERRAERLQGDRRAAVRADARGGRQRDREGDRQAGSPAADDARAGLGGARNERLADGRRHARRGHPRARRAAPGWSPAAPTWWSARARARRRCPSSSSRSTGSTSCGGSTTEDGSLRSARSSPTPSSPPIRSSASRLTALADACGDRRLARDPGGRDDRRQPDERVAGDGDRRAAAVLRRDGHAAVEPGTRTLDVDELLAGPGRTTAEPGRAARARCEVPLPPARHRQRYVRLEYRRQMEIAVVGATAVLTLDGGTGDRRPRRDHRAGADDPPRPRGRGGAARQRRRRRRDRDRRAGGRRRVAADLATCARSADYRSAMAAVIGRRAIEVAARAGPRRAGSDPRQPRRCTEV